MSTMIKAKAVDNKVITGEVRFSYVSLFEPTGYGNDTTNRTYSVTILIDKKDKDTIDAILSAEKAAIAAGVAKGTLVKADPGKPNFKHVLRDGDKEKDTDEHPEYAGVYFINVGAKESNKPQVVDQNVQPILDQTKLYSGCYGRVSVNLYAYNYNGTKGVGAGKGLNHVQLIREGEPFGAPITQAEDDFDEIDFDEVDDDDLL